MTSVETERFILRPFEAQDIDFLNLLHGDAMVMRYILGRVRTAEENRAYLDRLLVLEQDHGIGQRIVILKDTMEPVGRCGFSFFYGIPEGDMTSYYVDPAALPDGAASTRVVELGYTFLREAWGKGYASEAAAAMADHGLIQQELPDIHSIIVKENTGSVAVANKLGAHRLGDCLCLGLPAWDYIWERK
ncbi:MAG: GNAT family N-acetyltransferase [Rhodobacteraceae bacterium]|nr:GNAT family N-acetyltransferase [Paracoccaceae bacterium]